MNPEVNTSPEPKKFKKHAPPLNYLYAAKPRVPPPMSLTPITEEEWSQFEGKARWDSVVALRGPDLTNSDTLKWFTSSVIRYKMSGVMRVGGLVNRQLPFVVLPLGHDLTGSKGFDCAHFIGHIYEAANWLHIPIAPCSPDLWKQILSGKVYYTESQQLLRDELPEGSSFKAQLEHMVGKKCFDNTPIVSPEEGF